jgi:hypothetical protein
LGGSEIALAKLIDPANALADVPVAHPTCDLGGSDAKLALSGGNQ